jgi:HAD superfamily hydrolase (TIGR01509 family)
MLSVTAAGEVSGHMCEKGITYGKEEQSNPTRNITTSVRIYGGTLPMLPVKTAKPIPKGAITEVVREIHKISNSTDFPCVAPVLSGDIILKNAANTGVDIIATRHIPMRAYIFDLDGTLLDSANIWNKINRDFFAKRNIPFPEDYQQIIGAMPFPQVAVYTKETYRLPETPEELMREFLAMSVNAYAHDVEMKPGAKDYLFRLHKNKHKMAVATAAPYELLTPALKHHKIYDLFDSICTTQDAGHGKTRPDVFILAAKNLHAKPCDCIVFDDILAAVKSAKSVGMTVCGVRDTQSETDWAEIKQLADYTITDFRDVPV